MRSDDLIRMRHMLEAAKEVLSFAKNKSRRGFDSNRMLVLSTVKSIEIIGEAASKVTQETREICAELPWANIIRCETVLFMSILTSILTESGIRLRITFLP